MKRIALTLLTAALAASALAAPAQAAFGLNDFDVVFTNNDGTVATQAGSHSFAMTTSFKFNFLETGPSEFLPDGEPKDLAFEQVAGFVGDATAMPYCETVDFLKFSFFKGSECPAQTAVGVTAVALEGGSLWAQTPVSNLKAPPGKVARIGFRVLGTPIVIDVSVKAGGDHNVTASSLNTPQTVKAFGAVLQLWGNPSDPAHDDLRGLQCAGETITGNLTDFISFGNCPADVPERPFLTLPRSCTGPSLSAYRATSWQGDFDFGNAFTHDHFTPPNPQGFTGCDKLGFFPTVDATSTADSAQSPSGLDFELSFDDKGLTSTKGLAQSDVKKAVVTLPEGMSANPSIAEGLEVCTETQLAAETALSDPGAGCPNGSKIGTAEVETPLLGEEVLGGSLFIAKPYENPFDSLLAMYLVIKDPKLGIIVKQPLKVEPDPVTGQLTTVAEDLPQLPFSHFRLHFREGVRSPLVTPSTCGTHEVEATLYPWSGGPPATSNSTFQITTGPNDGPCPKGGLPPFKPGLLAGTVNNRAGSFSPFNVRISRTDAEQEITHFSIKLPPGIVGKLAGIPYCSDAAIATAKARTGPLGGHEELADPSCPAASEVGRSLAGAGVGPSLTYAPGKVYLAGPYNGSKLSIVAITAGVVGPFDIGTVIIREALEINPETAEVFVDATGSDPIPHIIQGIPVHLRDIRAYVDRPDFVLNPTDCTRTSTASTVLGAGLDFVSESDDNPLTVTSPFQAADCAALPFEPQLTMRLRGGTKRGAHPAFSAHLQMNGIGEAGIAQAQVTLPRSEFIENAHFDTICTRVQFKAGAGNGAECPSGSIYGKAKAVTPILSEPLEGPVFLRSSEHQLPDLVVALHNSQVDFNLVGRVDSVKGKLRNTFETAPDAPVTSFDISLAGGDKGLFVNSTNLCKRKNRALVGFTGQNGKVHTSKPVLRVKCRGKKPKSGGK